MSSPTVFTIRVSAIQDGKTIARTEELQVASSDGNRPRQECVDFTQALLGATKEWLVWQLEQCGIAEGPPTIQHGPLSLAGQTLTCGTCGKLFTADTIHGAYRHDCRGEACDMLTSERPQGRYCDLDEYDTWNESDAKHGSQADARLQAGIIKGQTQTSGIVIFSGKNFTTPGQEITTIWVPYSVIGPNSEIDNEVLRPLLDNPDEVL